MARMGENLYFPPAERPGLHFQARGEILFGMDMDLMCSASPQNALRVKKKVHSPPQMRIALANHPESHNLCRSRQQPPAPPSSLYYERCALPGQAGDRPHGRPQRPGCSRLRRSRKFSARLRSSARGRTAGKRLPFSSSGTIYFRSHKPHTPAAAPGPAPYGAGGAFR